MTRGVELPVVAWNHTAMIRIDKEENVRNSPGFEFNVSFVDRASMFVESVFETSVSFSHVL